MRTRYGAVVIAIIVLAFSVFEFALEDPSKQERSPCPGVSHEAVLACGDLIPLTELTMNDAQLLSQIPERALRELIEHRTDVIIHSHSLPRNKRHEAFEMIDGIGEARAKELGRTLSFN
jgi:hypothetical protein